MKWLVFFSLSLLVLVGAVIWAIVMRVSKYKRGRVLTPFNVILGGVFIAGFLSLLPIYHTMLNGVSSQNLKTVLFALHNTFQLFTIDADKDIVEYISCSEVWLKVLYSAYLSIIHIVAPLMTFGFLMSFFNNVSAMFRYMVHYFDDVYIFSELNEKSLALGEDIKHNHPKATIVYTDVFENSDEISYELTERAKESKAICFKKDILAINFKRHYTKAKMKFFIIGKDETENINQSLKLINLYKNRTDTELFVFSTGIDSELLLTKADKGKIKVRRVNEIKSLINRILYDKGTNLFTNAKKMSDGSKKISAVLVGLGQYGTEMLKALTWYCQMDGYHIEIDAFDIDEKAEERFSALAPELMSENYNGVSLFEEAEYTIRIHSGYDITTKSFTDKITELTDTTYVFVALGSDSMNIRTAVDLRMWFERMKIKPVIHAVVCNTEEKEALTGITNYRGQAYNIEFIGDVKTSYSETVIINSQLENKALEIHKRWGAEDEFWAYEYNYNSSVASAVHKEARIQQNIPGATKKEEDLTDEEKDTIATLEHRRWNAYMRSEGYIYKETRNDLAKMHHDLVDYSSLTEEEKRKDSKIGTN